MGSKKLFLPGYAEELPDFAVRSAAVREGFGGDQVGRRGDEEDRHYARAPRRRRGQEHSFRDHQRGGFQSGGHTLDGDRQRAGYAFPGRGVCLSYGAEGNPDQRRDQRLRHGEGAASVRLERVRPSGWSEGVWRKGRDQEHEHDFGCPAGAGLRNPPANRGVAEGGEDFPGNTAMGRRDRARHR